MSRKRKTYTKEFKEGAVIHLRNSGLKLTEVAKELGVDHSTLSRWDKEFDKENAFPGQGNDRDKEMARILRENEILKERCEILKKAMAIFSQ